MDQGLSFDRSLIILHNCFFFFFHFEYAICRKKVFSVARLVEDGNCSFLLVFFYSMSLQVYRG